MKKKFEKPVVRRMQINIQQALADSTIIHIDDYDDLVLRFSNDYIGCLDNATGTGVSYADFMHYIETGEVGTAQVPLRCIVRKPQETAGKLNSIGIQTY